MSTLFSLFRAGNWQALAVIISVRVFTVFCVLPIHEYAHALTAHRLGDETARLAGRLTIRPTAHLHPIGTVMILLFGMGFANPVPVNPNNFRTKNKKAGFALTAAAGPLSNLIMALFWYLVMNLLYFIGAKTGTSSSILGIAVMFMYYAGSINVALAVFNLIPVPPLDGSRLLTAVLPDRIYYKIMRYERYIMIGLMVLLFVGVLDVPLSFLNGVISRTFILFTGLPFGTGSSLVGLFG